MPTMLDSIRLCCCFEIDRADLVRPLPTPSSHASAAASEFEHLLPFHPEEDCLQRWLDLNA